MKIVVNKQKFVDSIIAPSSKLAENLLLTGKNGLLKTITSSADNSVILQSSIDYKGEDINNLIIPEVKTFLRLFSNIEDEEITLNVNDNQILYKSENISFKYHLLDETYFTNKKTLNEEKLNKLSYDIEFQFSKQKLSEILKYNSIIPEAQKLYFYANDKNVVAKIGDEQKPNINEITTTLAEQYDGDFSGEMYPLSIENILLLCFSDVNSINISIKKDLKIFKFETPGVRYILSGLVK
jgi:hypothetical protein